MTFDDLPGNLARVRDDIARIQAAAGVSGDVRIVAVTKGHPGTAVEAAARTGLADIGENRVQEALGKQESAPPGLRWHLIGHLQTNKTKFVPGRFWMVQSLDSERVIVALARAMDAARTDGRVGDDERLPVLIEVNVGGEAQKSGCAPAEAATLVAQAASLGFDVRGLMTVAPFTDDEAVQRRVFAELRTLRDEIATRETPLPELSMGMSGDYQAAVAEGATIVRLGTVLFGARER
jgi:hypothetical protein